MRARYQFSEKDHWLHTSAGRSSTKTTRSTTVLSVLSIGCCDMSPPFPASPLDSARRSPFKKHPSMSTTTYPKLVVVVGATGNQGGSVARRFLREGPDRFRVRGLTRDPSSGPARELTALGAEVVRADLNDAGTLGAAFRGASVIFSATNYWEPFFPPGIEASRARAKALGLGGGVREYAGRVELAQGRNIADAAAATVGSLDANGFIASTLSHAGRCSGGLFKKLYHFDAKAEVFPYYVREQHPALAAKMSCVQTGYFMTSHRILPDSYFVKVSSYRLSPLPDSTWRGERR